jgi:hypothetical protein
MGNVENVENVVNSVEYNNKLIDGDSPDVLFEEYEYKCPVPGCKNRVKDTIEKGGFYMCGVPTHCCPSCIEQGWKHLSGHGGDDETWKEEPKKTTRERVIILNKPQKYTLPSYEEKKKKKEEEEEEEEEKKKKKQDDDDTREMEEYEYKCPVPGCKNRVKDTIKKGGFYMCGIPKHCCPSCIEQGWQHLSGHGGDDETWKEEPTNNV